MIGSIPAAATSVFRIGGDLPVNRLGYGTMNLTGPGHWYHPPDTDNAKAVLRRAVDLGINHLDTADAYGPETAEHLIRKALHPYPQHLVIATKGGLTRPSDTRRSHHPPRQVASRPVVPPDFAHDPVIMGAAGV